MEQKIAYLETEKKKYPLVFNLNVMEEIQEIYGSMQNWADKCESGDEPNIKDLKNGIMAMINEGIDILNEESDTKEPFVTSKQLGRIITEIGFAKVIEKIKEVQIDSTKTEEESKNE